jgi:hypothetical protein
MVAGSPPSDDHVSITEDDHTAIVGVGDGGIARQRMTFLLNPLSAEDEVDSGHGETTTRLPIEREEDTFNED